MKAPKKEDDQFTPEETQRRFDAALRGARIAGHKPMKPSAPKRKRTTKKPRSKRA